jgi:hypothetical protein
MAITALSSGTQTAVIGTEHFLPSSFTGGAGSYTFHVDTVNMAAGDVIELRVYQMIITSGTARVAYFQRYEDVQSTDDLIKVSVPISNELTDTNALQFSLKQIAGTGRAYQYKVLRYS